MSPVKTQMQYVYILMSLSDKKFYTSCTSDLRACFIEHQKGKVTSIKNHGSFELIYYEACTDKFDAYAREKYLKTGVGQRYLKNRLKRALVLTR